MLSAYDPGTVWIHLFIYFPNIPLAGFIFHISFIQCAKDKLRHISGFDGFTWSCKTEKWHLHTYLFHINVYSHKDMLFLCCQRRLEVPFVFGLIIKMSSLALLIYESYSISLYIYSAQEQFLKIFISIFLFPEVCSCRSSSCFCFSVCFFYLFVCFFLSEFEWFYIMI